MNELKVEVWDWVVLKDGSIIQIDHDDMHDVYHEDILRLATKEEIPAYARNLEKRMYFFVPYNISPIQQAIQAGHAALDYARKYKDDEEFIDFADNWKTWIILNGGTTNSHGKPGANFREDTEPYLGSLDNIAQQVIMNNVKHSLFQEPDLNDALTAVCFICDERVFNYEDYPEFDDWFCTQEFPDNTPQKEASFITYSPGLRAIDFPTQYKIWVKFLGGEKNVFLRELLKGKRFA